MPEPVVPATRPCGPSDLMSSSKGPSLDSPITAFVVRPRRAQRSSSRRASGCSSRRTSSSRLAPGSVLERSSVETSRIGASARAIRWSHRSSTRSGRIASTVRSPVTSRLSWSPSQPATVRHSSGQLTHRLVEAEEEDAARGPLLEQRDHPRRHPDLAGAVEDDDAAGQAGPLLLLELPARLELGQQAAGLEGLGVVVGGQPHRARVVLGGTGVRQPLDPVPRRGRVGAGQHRQGDVGGTVHRGHLRDRPHRHGTSLARPGRRSRRRRPSGT